MHETAKHLRQLRLVVPEKVQEKEDHKVFKPHLGDSSDSKGYKINQIDGIWHINGKRIEQITNMTNWDNIEAVARFYDILKKLGISRKLTKLGVKTGDIILIGSKSVEFVEPLS